MQCVISRRLHIDTNRNISVYIYIYIIIKYVNVRETCKMFAFNCVEVYINTRERVSEIYFFFFIYILNSKSLYHTEIIGFFFFDQNKQYIIIYIHA